ncbi:hypothetical protein JB92DRAFT_2912213 [Gautieria morchelliformis]|nr:hypothetical protein JB92DRAFT_2912213 [Gautieria morchelliformis]
MSLDITAHHFNVDSSPPSSTLLLEAARKLVDAASSSKWSFIRPPIARLSPTGTHASACFEWGREPPLIDRNTGDTDSELRDWDAPFDDDMEVININSLPDFEEMDFGDVFVQPGSRPMKCIPGSAPSTHGRRGEVDVNSNTQPRKRLRSQSKTLSTPPETISISKLIPFPHYYESPDPARPPPRGIDSIPAFHVARSLSPSVSLTAPFARTAWLVPLRGVPPFDGASSAKLNSMHTDVEQPPDPVSPRTIQWTPAAVTQFWTFLLRQRSMNNFGPISLGYMFSSPSVQKNQSKNLNARWDNRSDHKRGKGKNKQIQNKKLIQTDSADSNETAQVMVWEYIKIYHDAQYAMKLRSLLDSFRWEDDIGWEKGRIISDALPRQYRVLKATRLVLVDETGEAILLA